MASQASVLGGSSRQNRKLWCCTKNHCEMTSQVTRVRMVASSPSPYTYQLWVSDKPFHLSKPQFPHLQNENNTWVTAGFRWIKWNNLYKAPGTYLINYSIHYYCCYYFTMNRSICISFHFLKSKYNIHTVTYIKHTHMDSLIILFI